MPNQEIKLIISAINGTGPVIQGVLGSLKQLGGSVIAVAAQVASVKYVFDQTFRMAAAAIQGPYEAVEGFNQSVVQMAAQITNMMKGSGNLGEDYRIARDYAANLVEKLEEIDAKTVAGAADLRLMTQEMLKQGILLDVNNERQVKGFQNIANAVAVVAQGGGAKEIQIRQELRALLQGQVNLQSQLASQLDVMVGGSLKQKVALWQKEGTLIEEIGELLKGYAAGADDIEGTWAAIGSTLETVKSKILRIGFKELYADINALFTEMNSRLKENSQTIGGALHMAFRAVQGVLESIWNLLQPLGLPLQFALGIVLEIGKGLAYIAYTILPPLTERIGAFLKSMMEIVFAVGRLGTAFYKLLQLDFKGAAAEAKKAKEHWQAAGKDVGKAFSRGFGDEVERRYNEMVSKFSAVAKPVKKPDLGGGGDETGDKIPEWQKAGDKSVYDAQVAYYKAIDDANKRFGKARLDDLVNEQKEEAERKQALVDGEKRYLEAVGQYRQKESDVVRRDLDREAAEEAERNQARLDSEMRYLEAVTQYREAENKVVADSIAKAAEENKKAMQGVIELTRRTADAMEQNFSDLFFDAMTGKFKDLGDYAKAILQSIQRASADYLGGLLTTNLFGKSDASGKTSGGWIEGAVSWIGGLLKHSGGMMGEPGQVRYVPSITFAGAPRYHSGIGPGERPAIIRDDEGVFTPGQMKALGAAAGHGGSGGGSVIHLHLDKIVIQAVDAKSFYELAARNPQAIVGPFLNALQKGGQVRDAIRGAL